MDASSTLSQDFSEIVENVGDLWADLRNTRIFFTGGTGLIGRWMLETLRIANDRHDLNVKVVVLTRDRQRFAKDHPHLFNYQAYDIVTGDVLTLPQSGEQYSHVMHAATDASAHLNEHDPLRMFDTIVTGTRNVLDFAKAAGARRTFFFSSGAVYGAQPAAISHVAEDYLGGPDTSQYRSAYGEGKRAAEQLCAIYKKQFGMDIVNARIFALLGPMLSLDIHFAAGNFIRDSLAGKKISVHSDGRAERSYLYTGDLTEWLWTILLKAPAGAIYNVGSERAISIGELANLTSRLLGGAGAEILGQPDSGWNPGRYVPSTAKIRNELGLAERVNLEEAIRRTAIWNGWIK